MKKLITSIFVWFLGVAAIAQTPEATFEMKTENFKQLNETSISWELWIKKASGDDFGLYTWHLQWEFYAGVLNGGQFLWDDFIISAGADAVFMEHYSNGQATVPDGVYFNYTPNSFPNTAGTNMTLITSDWKHIATYTAQLSKDGSPHNFASAAIDFAHRTGGVVEVFAAQQPYVIDSEGQISGSLTTAAGVPINTRQLASHWFTGEGTWNEAARWNNVTAENANELPSAANNAGIAGQATVSDNHEVNQLAINDGGYLLINTTGELTTQELFNDNVDAAKSYREAVTIAEWNFEDTGQTELPYLADDGIIFNDGVAPITTTGAFVALTDGVPGGTRVVMGQNFYGTTGFPPSPDPKDWRIQLSSAGYINLKLSSKQWSDQGAFGTAGPTQFQIQWSIDGSTWDDVIDGIINVAEDWTTGVLTDLSLPVDIENSTSFYIRWLNTSGDKMGYTAIDDILITGEEIPPPPTGIVIQSDGIASGSLIHASDVEATFSRTITTDRWHNVGINIQEGTTIGSSFFFDNDPAVWVQRFDEPTDAGAYVTDLNYAMPHGTGYWVWFAEDADLTLQGTLQANDFTLSNMSYSGPGWNFVANPFAAPIRYHSDENWTMSNIDGTIYLWDVNDGIWKFSNAEAVGSIDDGIIPVGQSFFIKADDASNTLTIPAAARQHNAQGIYKATSENLQWVSLKLSEHTGSRDQIFVSFSLDGQETYESGRDAYKRMNEVEGGTNLYILHDDLDPLSINHLPYNTDARMVQLGYEPGSSGEHLITALLENLPEGDVVLEDTKTKQLISLRENPDYSFTAEADDEIQRFRLHFFGVTNITEGAAASQDWQVYTHAKTLVIRSLDVQQMSEKVRINVYNVLGKTVHSQIYNGQSLIHIPLNNPSQVLVVSIQSETATQTNRVFID